MDIGISLSSSHVGFAPHVAAQRMIERARAAHDAGLSSLSVGDHHNMATSYVQNTPILGRLLAEWTGRPAGVLFLLPLWNPLLAAEQVGTLAAIHDGPFVVQAGIGYGDEQFHAFGTTAAERGRRIDESIPVIQRLLAGEVVDSPMFDVKDGRVGLLPPEPVTWWIGAGADVAIDRAARLGDAWYAAPGLDVDAAGERLAHYRARCQGHGRGGRAVLRRDVLALRDDARANRLGDEIIAKGYRGLGPEQLIVGGAAEVTDQLGAYAELGFDEVIIRCMSPDQDVALETIEVFGNVVV